MAKDNGEESLPEAEDEMEWTEDPPADVPDEPESPALVDHTVETTEAKPEMVTYIRQPNGKLVPYKPGMDNR